MADYGLSVLIFSRNNVGRTLDLIMDLYPVADEIVLVDSGLRANRRVLYSEKGKRRLLKLRIFYAVALGYPDPLRMWALGKCRHRWVLLVDTDERLSPALKENIKSVIKGSRYAAFGIKRYEDVRKGSRSSFFTWQIRLFQRRKIIYKGVPHDQPLINGRTGKLKEEFYMEHIRELRSTSREHDYQYIDKFDRYSYRMYNKMMAGYFERMTLSGRDSAVPRLLSGLLSLYEKVTFAKPETEVRDFDYFAYYAIKVSAFTIKKRDLRGFFRIIPGGFEYLDRIKKWKSEEGGEELFEILKIIYDIGIIKFLGLDKDRTIKRLNRKYGEHEQGIELLVMLLRERYKEINRQSRN